MRKNIFAGALILGVAGVFCSCKGRTMSNMEPTGDTVEVQIAPAAADMESDSLTSISSTEVSI